MPEWSFEELARMIDHMLLHPMLDDKELIRGMAFAVECNCASVCIKCRTPKNGNASSCVIICWPAFSKAAWRGALIC